MHLLTNKRAELQINSNNVLYYGATEFQVQCLLVPTQEYKEKVAKLFLGCCQVVDEVHQFHLRGRDKRRPDDLLAFPLPRHLNSFSFWHHLNVRRQAA